jgi:hypothetical protein
VTLPSAHNLGFQLYLSCFAVTGCVHSFDGDFIIAPLTVMTTLILCDTVLSVIVCRLLGNKNMPLTTEIMMPGF